MNEFKIIRSLLNEKGEKFPAKVKVICGKTFYFKDKGFWKAILLTETKYGNIKKQQLRLYGWGWSRRKNKWYQAQKFNISAANYLGDIIDLLHVFAQESGKEQVLKKVDEKLLFRINELERLKNNLERQKSRIPELKRGLKTFDQLINSKRVTEPQIQKFLKNNTWIFGTNYTRMHKSEAPITVKSRNDFLLQRFDKYFDILDLKLPNFPLFTKVRGNKRAMSKELKNAISQVMIYLAEARTYYLTIKDQTDNDIYFPEGIIVIGRRKDEDKNLLKIHQEFLNKIKIMTYDDLLDTAKETIKRYSKKK